MPVAAPPDVSRRRRDGLFDEQVSLEKSHRAGLLSESAHFVRREALIDRLVALDSGADASQEPTIYHMP